MKRAFNLLLFLPVAVMVLVASTWLYAQIPQPHMHPSDAACESCHLAGANVAPDNASLLVTSQEQLCIRCHPDAVQMSHPSGFAPPAGLIIPAEYPLDWKGEVTCSTCHEVHGDVPGKLRGTARGQDMCVACHDQAFFDNMPDNGISLMYQGHLSIQDARGWQGLDQYSIQCLECHGENGDPNTDGDPASLAANQIMRHGSLNHPVGISYGQAALNGSYRPVNKLSNKVVLPNGVISCISCHEGYSMNHGKLVIAKTKSALCRECHEY